MLIRDPETKTGLERDIVFENCVYAGRAICAKIDEPSLSLKYEIWIHQSE